MDAATARNLTVGLLIVLIVLVIAQRVVAARRAADRFALTRTREVRAPDGLQYRVHLIHKDSDDAAEMMATLNQRSIELMRHLRDKFLRGDGGTTPAREKMVNRLLELYNPDSLAENSPRDPDGDTSYTINKGEVLALCLRKKATERDGSHAIHDVETLTFVTLHELSHIAIEDRDHPKIFWRSFKFILEEARAAGVIRGIDYSRAPTVYCGMDIDYNPLFDRSLAPV